jgi:hypothetical protein
MRAAAGAGGLENTQKRGCAKYFFAARRTDNAIRLDEKVGVVIGRAFAGHSGDSTVLKVGQIYRRCWTRRGYARRFGN